MNKPYSEARILLDSPQDILPHDRLHRNGEFVLSVIPTLDGFEVRDRFGSVYLLDEPIHVWRTDVVAQKLPQ